MSDIDGTDTSVKNVETPIFCQILFSFMKLMVQVILNLSCINSFSNYLSSLSMISTSLVFDDHLPLCFLIFEGSFIGKARSKLELNDSASKRQFLR